MAESGCLSPVSAHRPRSTRVIRHAVHRSQPHPSLEIARHQHQAHVKAVALESSVAHFAIAELVFHHRERVLDACARPRHDCVPLELPVGQLLLFLIALLIRDSLPDISLDQRTQATTGTADTAPITPHHSASSQIAEPRGEPTRSSDQSGN